MTTIKDLMPCDCIDANYGDEWSHETCMPERIVCDKCGASIPWVKHCWICGLVFDSENDERIFPNADDFCKKCGDEQ